MTVSTPLPATPLKEETLLTNVHNKLRSRSQSVTTASIFAGSHQSPELKDLQLDQSLICLPPTCKRKDNEKEWADTGQTPAHTPMVWRTGGPHSPMALLTPGHDLEKKREQSQCQASRSPASCTGLGSHQRPLRSQLVPPSAYVGITIDQK